MRAQAKVRERYVVVRLTHQQLLQLDQRLRLSLPEGWDTKATEIIGLVAKAVIQGKRGNLSRAGQLYDDRRHGL